MNRLWKRVLVFSAVMALLGAGCALYPQTGRIRAPEPAPPAPAADTTGQEADREIEALDQSINLVGEEDFATTTLSDTEVGL